MYGLTPDKVLYELAGFMPCQELRTVGMVGGWISLVARRRRPPVDLPGWLVGAVTGAPEALWTFAAARARRRRARSPS